MTLGKRPFSTLLALVAAIVLPATVSAQAKKPNVVVIWATTSATRNQGMMGYRTPNIDRGAREGALLVLLPQRRRFAGDAAVRPVEIVFAGQRRFSLDKVLETLTNPPRGSN
jgi:hypothetical protein